jgi:hypothetical protein
MPRSGRTSRPVAKKAAKALRSKRRSATTKTLAGSALSQAPNRRKRTTKGK